MERVYNFSAGPSMLPLEVLEKAQKELVCYGDTGMSVMEMSHRSKPFEKIIQSAEATLRELMHIPDNYKVLFLQGGGSTQFAMIPLNLMNKNKKCDIVLTGQWSKKAKSEASKYGKVNVVASSEDKVFSYIPELDKSKFDPEADYFYITYNNTIYGTRYTQLPDTGNVPLVTDISSIILSEEIDAITERTCDPMTRFQCSSIEDMLMFEFWEMLTKSVRLRKCKRCGKYFIMKGNYDTNYCDRVAEGETRNCQELAAQENYKRKMADNAAIPLYQKYYKRYAARVKVRQIKETDFKKWKYQAMTKRDECSDGKITLSEFEEWLESSFPNRKKKN